MKTTLHIKAETADKLRAAAPALGFAASTAREIVGPGIEALHLDPFTAAAFELERKRARVGVDAMVSRIAGRVVRAAAQPVEA